MKKPLLLLALIVGGVAGGIFLFVQIILGLFDYIVDPPTPTTLPMSFGTPEIDKPDVAVSRFGFIDRSGKTIIPATFEDGSNFHEGLCAVRIKDHWGFIDKTGKLVVPAKYDRVRDFSEGLAAARTGRMWGFIDNAGNWVVQPSWLAVADYHHGVAVVGSGSPRYQWVMGQSLAVARETGAIIDKSGKFVFQPQHCAIAEAEDGVIVYCNTSDNTHKLFGLLDESGAKIAEAKFEDMRRFSEGLIAVRSNGKWGFIDKTGKMVIPATFDHAGAFHNGLATAALNGEFGIIDKSGTFVLKPAYKHLSSMTITPALPHGHYRSDGLTPIAIDKKWGFADTKTGKITIKPQYWQVDMFSEGLARVGMHPEAK